MKQKEFERKLLSFPKRATELYDMFTRLEVKQILKDRKKLKTCKKDVQNLTAKK